MCDISVIMPAYNSEKYIEKSIDSILNQSLSNIELIIINDGSADRTHEIINKYSDDRIKYYHNERNIGPGMCRNIGLDVARGKYIALLDSDDISPINRLEVEFDFLENNTCFDCVMGKMICIDENDTIINSSHVPLYNDKFIRAKLLFSNCIPNGSAMFRKDFIDRYEIRYRNMLCEDYMFWLDFAQEGHITCVKEPMLYYRINTKGITCSSKSSDRDEAIDKIHMIEYARRGLVFEEGMLKVLLRATHETPDVESRDELKTLYDALKIIVSDAEIHGYENTLEIKRACSKLLGMLINRSSSIWD